MVLYISRKNHAKVYYHFPDVRKMMGTKKRPRTSSTLGGFGANENNENCIT